MTVVIRINEYQNDVFVIQKYSFNDSDTPLLLSVNIGNMDSLNETIERVPNKTFEMLDKVLKDLSNSNEAVITYYV